jgi:hypothetical protein
LFFSIELFFAIKVSWVSAFEAWFLDPGLTAGTGS